MSSSYSSSLIRFVLSRGLDSTIFSIFETINFPPKILSVTLTCPLESRPFFGLKIKPFFRRRNVVIVVREFVSCALQFRCDIAIMGLFLPNRLAQKP